MVKVMIKKEKKLEVPKTKQSVGWRRSWRWAEKSSHTLR